MAKSSYAGLTLPFFRTGLYTYRSQLFAPLKSVGINVVQMRDALIDGQDIEVTDKLELSRRFGFSRFCSVQLAGGEIINQFYSDRAIVSGVSTLFPMFDSNQRFATFTANSITTLWTKSSSAQAFVETVGSQIYICNGTANGQKRYDTVGAALHTLGMPGPAAAPVLTPPTSGSTFWQPSATYSNASLGPVMQDFNGNIQQASTTLVSGATVPNWLTTLSSHTTDGTGNWDCLATLGVWAASTVFAGSIVILDSNGNIQQNQTPGATSGATVPTWQTTVGNNTTDGGITWKMLGSGNFLAYTGWTYAFAYSTQAPTVASGYYHCSTASPQTITTGPVLGTSMSIPLSGKYSNNPDCTSIDIYRTRDGGSVLEYLASIANVVGTGTWNYTDTSNDSMLNPQIILPLSGNHQNDVPPGTTGTSAPSTDNIGHLSFWNGRFWACTGYKVYFDAGGDCQNGDPHASWPPANVFTYNSPVIATTPTSQGLLVWLNDAVKIILGGPQTLSYYDDDLMENFGISSANCVHKDGDTIRVLTTQGQYWELTVTDKVERSRLIADVVAKNFGPLTSYISAHRNGTDAGVFLGDGSTNIVRYGTNTDSWSTVFKPNGGGGALKSIETTPGTYTLCLARASAAGFILGRNLNVWQDDGNNYTNCFVTIGNIVLSQTREPLVPVHWISLLLNGGGLIPTVEVLPNEVSGVSGTLPNVWLNTTAYTTGQQVQFSQMVWTATQNSTNQQPSTNSAFWVFTAWAITFTPIPNPVVDVGMRAPLSVTQLNWSLYNVQTLRDSLMMHHLQVKVTFPPANFPDTIKVLSLGPNEG